MTFIKTSLALSLGVAALCIGAQARAARALNHDATRVNLETDLSSRQSASHSRLIFAQQTKTTPLNSPFAKLKPDTTATSTTSAAKVSGRFDENSKPTVGGSIVTKRNPVDVDLGTR